MKLRLTMNLDNSAFDNNGISREAATILESLIVRLNDLDSGDVFEQSPFVLIDSNGNRVGKAEFFE